jgi:hypothetical protein
MIWEKVLTVKCGHEVGKKNRLENERTCQSCTALLINLRREIAEESGDWNSIPSEQYSGL